MTSFHLTTVPLHGAAVDITSDQISELDRVTDDSNFASATLKLNLGGLPPLAKLNVMAILFKSRSLLAAGMMVVGADTTPVVVDPTAKNPIFAGGRFSGPALDRFLETTTKTFGFKYEARTQELVLQFGGDKFVIQAVTRRLLNVVKFCSSYTKRFNTSKKFRWETFDSISRLRTLPVIQTNVQDQEEV